MKAARTSRGLFSHDVAAATTLIVGKLAGSIIAATITSQPARNNGIAKASGGPPSISAW